MKKVYRYLAIQQWEHEHAHEILSGIIEFSRSVPGQHIMILPLACNCDQLKRSYTENGLVDGIIAPGITNQLEALIKTHGWKYISTLIGSDESTVPQVDVDHGATGQMAAEYLLSKGFEHFTYVGHAHWKAMLQREQGYRRHLLKAGKTEITPLHFSSSLAAMETKTVHQFLRGLTKPCAIWCQDDLTAMHLHVHCLALGYHIPDELALLGTQDAVRLCEGMRPSLSSINMPYRKIGYKACDMLHKWLTEGSRPTSPVTFPPNSVTERASTETLAINDVQLKSAIRYLRDHCTAENLNMEEAAHHAGLSLRDMQRKFRQKLGHTPTMELSNARIRKVKEMLRTTNHTLDEIAWRCGYPSATYLCTQFRNRTGRTPGSYRQSR